MRYFIPFLIFLWSLSSFGKSKLPLLATKQAINNLRFISADGDFTYYQNREGSLLLSTNYKVVEVLSSSPGTYYQVVSSPARKNLILEQQQSFHKYFGIRKMKTIYQIPFGGTSVRKLGRGLNPRLHVNDEWVSIYHPISKKLKFVNLKSSALTFDIPIKNTFNPYFIPQVVMTNSNTIIFTDLNKDGIPGVLYFDKITKNTTVLYKGSNPATKFELCLDKEELYFGEFGLDTMYSGSSISRMQAKTIDFSKRDLLYESKLNDVGNLHCQDHLLFIQNLTKKRGKTAYEVVELSKRDKRIREVSDVNFASHIINMDGVKLLPHLGKYYVLKGKGDFTKTDRLKKVKKDE